MKRSMLALVLTFGCSTVAFAGPPRAHHPPARTVRQPPARTTAPVAGPHHDDRFTKVKVQLRSDRSQSGHAVTIYVNGKGAHLTGGYEDAASNRSSIIWGSGFSSVDIPAYSGGAARWQQVMTCVDQQFADFDVVISDELPAVDDYIMLMVGGSPRTIGEGNGVAGIAPFSGSVIPGAVGFAFSEVLGDDPRDVCETVAHEIGHTLGLDHTYECSDTMSYLFGCGDKSFQDQSMSCGEWDARSCSGGSGKQNSYAQLAAAVGVRSGDRPSPGPAPTPDPGPAPNPHGDPDPGPSPAPPDWDEGDRGDHWDDWGDWADWDEWEGWDESFESFDEGEIEWVDWDEWEEWDGDSGCS